MTTLERMSATTDVKYSYDRGVRVGYERAVVEIVEWMVAHGYPVGERDGIAVLLFNLESMAKENIS